VGAVASSSRSPRPVNSSRTPWLAARLPPWTRSWLADSAVLLVSQALTVVGTSAAAVLIARQLDPTEWGIFAGLWALSMALSMVIQFGAGTWLLRELSHLFADADAAADAQARSLVRAALVLNAGLGAAVLSVGVVVAELRGLERGTTVALTSLLAYSALIAASNLMEAHLRARRRVKRVALAALLEKFLLVVLVAAVASRGGVAAIGLAYIAAAVVRVAFVHRSVFASGRIEAGPSRREVGEAFRGSLPFALTTAFVAVIPKFDAFILLTLSVISAGYFALGERLVGAAVAFPDVLSVALFPFMSKRRNTSSPPWLLASIFGAVGAGAALVAFVVAPTLVPLVFGQQYTDAVPAVRVVLLALPILFAIDPLRVFAFSQRQERRLASAALATSLLGTVGIVTGQVAFGVVAAAGAYVGRQLLFLVALAWISARAGRANTPAAVPVLTTEAMSA
jgi:O-antigen/teichoic acid export membrane protein